MRCPVDLDPGLRSLVMGFDSPAARHYDEPMGIFSHWNDDPEEYSGSGLFRHWNDGGTSGASWWVSSRKDPRWNGSGRCSRSLCSIGAACDEYIATKTKELGEPPDDLEFGGMKD